MTTFCSISGTCTDSIDLSTGTIVAIVIGSLVGLTAIFIIICIIIVLCKRQRQPIVWVQPAVQQATAGYSSSVNMGYYPPYGPSTGFNVPPPVYQQ
jgi:hypothetical protein